MTKEEIFHNKLVHYNPKGFPNGMKNAFYKAMQEYADIKVAEAYHKERDGWISVKDRLPEINQSIIVSNNIGVYDDCQMIDSNRFWCHFYGYDNDSYIVSDVTHWQPLPPPPTNG